MNEPTAINPANSSPPPRRLGRSILAVLVGLLAGAALSLGTDVALQKAGVFPTFGQPMNDSLLALATAYRTVYSVIGCYIMARLAPNRPMQHALAGGFVGVLLSTVGAVTTWNHNFGPHWYPIALVVLAMPCAWLGGKLRLSQLPLSSA